MDRQYRSICAYLFASWDVEYWPVVLERFLPRCRSDAAAVVATFYTWPSHLCTRAMSGNPYSPCADMVKLNEQKTHSFGCPMVSCYSGYKTHFCHCLCKLLMLMSMHIYTGRIDLCEAYFPSACSAPYWTLSWLLYITTILYQLNEQKTQLRMSILLFRLL